MANPDPLSKTFDPAPAGKIRIVAWRQRTETWPHPDLMPIHAERAILLHEWASTHQVRVEDWGATDAERPAEYVELLILIQPALTAALSALATECVRRSFERRKEKAREEAGSDKTDRAVPPPPSVRPLMGLTIVNECGGTVIVLNPANQEGIASAVKQVMNSEWRGRLAP